MSAVAHIDEYKTGRFYTDEFRGSLSWNGYENNVLLRNDGPSEDAGDGADSIPKFVDVGMVLGADDVYDARGVAIADYDNDGDLDILVNHSQGDNPRDGSGVLPALLRNDIGSARSWIAVSLVGSKSSRQPAGATVTIGAGGREQMRLLSIGSGYASQSTDRLYFGLNRAEHVDTVRVVWPSGKVETYSDFPARSLLRITEGGTVEVSALATLDGAAPEGGASSSL